MIALAKINDLAGLQEYMENVGAVLEKYGAQRSFAAPVSKVLEGGPVDAVALLTFPDADAVDRFYNSEEYKWLLELRQRSAETTLVVAEGRVQLDGYTD
ncbi:hypothetical protein GCM10023080_066800 [Streptomyces pseudoechinosporeus]